jgi:hypothetical protein
MAEMGPNAACPVLAEELRKPPFGNRPYLGRFKVCSYFSKAALVHEAFEQRGTPFSSIHGDIVSKGQM